MKVRFKQQGGAMAPYVTYTPLVPQQGQQPVNIASQQPVQQQQTKSDDGKLKDKDLATMLKDIDGLPNDMTQIANSISDLYSLGSSGLLPQQDMMNLYISSLLKVKIAGFNKNEYEEAYKRATENDGLSEIGIASDGRHVYVRDINDSQIKAVNVADFMKNQRKYQAITNGELLQIRANSPQMAFNNDILRVVENGIGMEKVQSMLKSQLVDLGKSKREGTIRAYVDDQRVIDGLEVIKELQQAGVPASVNLDGLYEGDFITESQKKQAEAVTMYLYKTLPKNAQTLLQIRSGNVKNPIQGACELIFELVNATTSDTITGKLEYKGAYNKDGTKSSSSGTKDDSIDSNPYISMIREQGGQENVPCVILTAGGTTGMRFYGTRYSQLPRVNNDMSIDMLLSTGLQGIVQSRDGITFGDQEIGSDKLRDVLYDNQGGVVATLPCKINKNGNKVVNLEVLDKYSKVQEDLKGKHFTSEQEYQRAMAESLKRHQLDELIDASTGLPDYRQFTQFLVVAGYTTDKNIDINKDSKFIQKVDADGSLQDKLERGLSIKSGDYKESYSVDIGDKWPIFEWGYDDVYRASIYIPLNNNLNAAVNAWDSGKISMNEAKDLEYGYQIRQKGQTMGGTSAEQLQK